VTKVSFLVIQAIIQCQFELQFSPFRSDQKW